MASVKGAACKCMRSGKKPDVDSRKERIPRS